MLTITSIKRSESALRLVLIGKSLSLANIICRSIADRSLTNIKWILLKDTFKCRNKFILFHSLPEFLFNSTN
jgi:hypothetical protein